jgi:hypothetical protein
VAGDQIVCMYMASIPPTRLEPNFPGWDGTLHEPDKHGTLVQGVKAEGIKAPELFNDLDALLEAIFALEGTTAEIYRLKSKAFLIKAKQNDGIKGT